MSNTVKLVIGVVLIGLGAALKALVPLEAGWTWLPMVCEAVGALAAYFVVPGTAAQVAAHGAAK